MLTEGLIAHKGNEVSFSNAGNCADPQRTGQSKVWLATWREGGTCHRREVTGKRREVNRE